MHLEHGGRFFRPFVVTVLVVAWGAAGAFAADAPPLYTKWEITAPTPLLNDAGTLASWGWSRRPVMTFDRALVAKNGRSGFKEWDFYTVTSPDCYIQVTLVNLGWAVMASTKFIDYRTMELTSNFHLGMGDSDLSLPSDPKKDMTYGKGEFRVSFSGSGKVRTLKFEFPKSMISGPRMRGEIQIEDDPEQDILATAMPFKEPGLFSYALRSIALPASGEIEVGDDPFVFKSGETFAARNWEKGILPKDYTWGCAVAAGMVDGKRVGFNIGFGDEDSSRFTGNGVFCDGVLHKLGEVPWTWDKKDAMQPWSFKSEDGRFDVVLKPAFDQSNATNLGVFSTKTSKAQGTVSGRVVLDDGTVLELTGLQAFAEYSVRRW